MFSYNNASKYVGDDAKNIPIHHLSIALLRDHGVRIAITHNYLIDDMRDSYRHQLQVHMNRVNWKQQHPSNMSIISHITHKLSKRWYVG